MMTKTPIWMIAILIVASVSLISCPSSTDRIRQEILEDVPIGSTLAEVDSYIEKEGFILTRRVLEWPEWDPFVFWSGEGSGFVSAIVEEGTFVWKYHIVAYWVLDENQRVKEIVVEEYADAF